MFKNILKKSTASILIFSICCVIAAGVSSNIKVNASAKAELEQLIAQLQEDNKRIDQQISNINGDIATNKELQNLVYDKLVHTKDQVDYYNNLLYLKEDEISKKEIEIADLENDILNTEKEIDDRKKDISSLEKENDDNLDKFGSMVRAVYISGGNDMLEVLANSKDFYDLLVRAKMMKNINEANTQFMDELKESIANLEQKIAELDQTVLELGEKKQKASDDKATLEIEKAELVDTRNEAESLMGSYNSDYNKYSSLISDFKDRQDDLEDKRKANAAEVEAYEKQIQAIIQAAQQGSSQVYDNGDWLWPVSPKFTYLTTYFGYDQWRGGNHSGIDIGNAGINGSNIYASKSGVVIKAKTTYIQGYSYGKYVVIDHGNGYSTLYGHCSQIYVTEGQQVSQGDVIAAVGSTGWSTGPHLHFEVRTGGVAQNPLNYVAIP